MKILNLFSKSKEERDQKQNERTAKALKRGQEALIDGLEKRADDAQNTIDKLVEGDISSINTETFNKTYHEAKLELILVEQELKVAEAVRLDLYTNEEESK